MITFTTTEEDGGVEFEIYMVRAFDQPAARLRARTALATKLIHFGGWKGDDKYENERLIAHGWPEDVWMHVDDLSRSAVQLWRARKWMGGLTRSTQRPRVLAAATAVAVPARLP